LFKAVRIINLLPNLLEQRVIMNTPRIKPRELKRINIKRYVVLIVNDSRVNNDRALVIIDCITVGSGIGSGAGSGVGSGVGSGTGSGVGSGFGVS
jgi:hypothetical protein